MPAMAVMLTLPWTTRLTVLPRWVGPHWGAWRRIRHDAMRQALPMVQAVLLMAVYIMVPLILAFAAYEYKTVITVTFVVFALNF